MHPLVELAKQGYSRGSHINVEFILENVNNKISEEFRKKANELVHNIEEYPHAFVLASLMDSGIGTEKAWSIPYKVYEALGTFDIFKLSKYPLTTFEQLFSSGKEVWHRYPTVKAKVFFDAIHAIINNPLMKGDASKIWKDKPSSQEVVLRFLEFNGCGFKIANMCPNLLTRYFGIEFSDYKSIDLAPDVHTIRVFQRLGLTPTVNDPEIAKIYSIIKARELNPEFPGIIDGLCWEVGKYHCHPSNPDCLNCQLTSFCEKKFTQT